jgi:predicted enzyme related to lactoylglutathione lyase
VSHDVDSTLPAGTLLTISHVHCRVRDLAGAVDWFRATCDVAPSFTDARIAVFPFGAFTLILDAAADDSLATIGFASPDCDADVAALAARGAQVLEPPQNRPYGARVAYVQGPGALTIEIEQLLPPAA